MGDEGTVIGQHETCCDATFEVDAETEHVMVLDHLLALGWLGVFVGEGEDEVCYVGYRVGGKVVMIFGAR